MNNPCVRCGKQRIIVREWTEKVETLAGVSLVSFTQTSCPDPECQKLVEEKHAMLKAKDDEIKRTAEKRNQERKKNSAKALKIKSKKTKKKGS